MTLAFFVRLFFVGVVRFIGLIVLLLWYQNFEVSPLPSWTLDVFVLLVVFLWTFLCTRWVFRRSFPTRRSFGVLVAVFLIGQVVVELWLTKKLTGATWGTTIVGAAHWGGLLQIFIHVAAMYLAYWRAKTRALLEHAPDEMHVSGTN